MRKIMAVSLMAAGIFGCQPRGTNQLSRVLGWPEGETPHAPGAFQVQEYARDLVNPRNLYVASNGDVFVAEASNSSREPSANRITLLRDANGDGNPELRVTFLQGLYQPYGMTIAGDKFYVANTDGLYAYPYKLGEASPSGPGVRMLALPAGDDDLHWTRNLLADEAHQKLYVSVGSSSNIGEDGMQAEYHRANILQIDLQTAAKQVYASGLRNPVGMAWAPGNTRLWTVVNERDGLPDHPVSDYLTSLQEGGFYGWPYSYSGKHLDERVTEQKPELVDRALTPDLDLGAHAVSAGLAFYRGEQFPSRYRDGAFIGQRGSWDKEKLSGYKVMFVPFADGHPSGPPENFLSGFIPDFNRNEVYGQPAAAGVAWDGSLLIADDAGNRVWRVSHK